MSWAPIQRLVTPPGWQVALMMQARGAQRLGLRAEYGVDYQLLQAARAQDKPVIELEGAAAAGDAGTAAGRRYCAAARYAGALAHQRAAAANHGELVAGRQTARHVDTLPATFSAGLYDVLMHQRNRDWRRQLEALPAGDYVVAVGALHLYGEDNLPAMLQPQG